MQKRHRIVVIHEFNGEKYFEPLKELYKCNEIESLYFIESSVVKQFIRNLIRDKKPFRLALKRAGENLLFRIRVPFIQGNTIILAIPPWDFRMMWYGLLIHKNRFIYHTSWPYWQLYTVPRRYGFLNYLFRSVWSRVLKYPNVSVVAVTAAAEKEVKQSYPDTETTTIPHGVNNNFFLVDGPSTAQEFRILYVGELSEKKGIKIIPEILTQLSDLPVHISFVGSGSLCGFVDELSNRFNVTTYGQVSDRNALMQIYAKHHLLIAPSLKTKKWEELFGMTIIEAMAVGLPVIASDHVGPRSLITYGQNGYLVSENNIENYSRIIRSLVEDSSKWSEISTNARVSAHSYALNTVIKSWSEILQDIQ